MMKFRNTCLSAVLSFSLVVGAPLALPSCAPVGASSETPLQRAVLDAQSVVQGASDAYAAFKKLYPQVISPEADAQVQAVLSAAPGLLATLSASSDPTVDAASLRGIESTVNQVLNVIAAAASRVPGVPASILLGLQAVAVIVPVLEQVANQLVPSAVPHVGVTPASFRSNLTVAQARAVLKR